MIKLTELTELAERCATALKGLFAAIHVSHNEVTLETDVTCLKALLGRLRDHQDFCCEQLIDLCAVDYLSYGQDDWETESATESGFSRGVMRQPPKLNSKIPVRFAVVYHLLSLQHNFRLRVKVFLPEENLVIPSVHDLFKVADWFEREAYDLYGILFEGHPDLRRLLTDYGFIGHPFRKDFPVSGHVEMRYDATLKKVVYEPVSIEPRTLVPKVIRDDNRYIIPVKPEANA